MAYPPINLCATCQTIPFDNLAPFPDSSYSRTCSGKKYLHRLIHDPSQFGHEPVPNPLGVRHHPDLPSLRAASAAGCDICREIERLADGLLADLADDAAYYANHPRVRLMPGDPSFESWVTGRGEAGEGFWVSTKSVKVGDEHVFAVAGFGFCVEDDQSPLASTFPGRPITGPVDSTVLDRIVCWVKACDSHVNCTDHESTLPTRVIDIGGPDPETTVRLIEPEAGTKGRYTALSYCWGEVSNPYVTSRAVLASRKTGFSVADLPRTFQDAITMTRMLGVRYIWIDSLCICQDDMQDWERESARMAAVYSKSYLTIAATGSSDTSGGLFFDRRARQYFRTEYGKTPGDSDAANTKPTVLISPLPTDKEALRSFSIEMADEPLSKRGWAFQERVLARRVLHFASDQTSLECLEGTVFEDGLRLPHRFDCAHQASWLPVNDDANKRRFNVMSQWHALLRQYGTRELTFAADKLPALSGIAKAYADLLGDEYLAGIWKGAIIEGLSWQGLGCKPYEGPYRAPSWSWAAVDGTAATGSQHKHRDLVTVVECHVDVDGDNPFGRVNNAWIKLEAALVPVYLSQETGPTGYMCLETRSGTGRPSICGFDTINRNYSVSAEAVRQMRLFALVLAGFGSEAQNADQGTEIEFYTCLVVTPAGESNGEHSAPGPVKRLGWIFFRPDNFGPGVLDSKVTVTLV